MCAYACEREYVSVCECTCLDRSTASIACEWTGQQLSHVMRAKRMLAFEDYIALGGESAAGDAGKLRAEGKSYIVQDGDVMHFLHSN